MKQICMQCLQSCSAYGHSLDINADVIYCLSFALHDILGYYDGSVGCYV